MAAWSRFQTEAQRGYRIGERNPATLPNGTKEREGWRENADKSRHWRKARAWAVRPGGKYI